MPEPVIRLPAGSWRIAVRRAWHGFMRHRGIDAAAALTFFTIVMAFPAALALTSAFALASNRRHAVEDLVALAGSVLPDAVADSLREPIGQLLQLASPGIALAAAIALLLWTGSGYATAFGRAVDAVYEVQEGRPFWAFRLRMLAVSLVLAAVATAITLCLLATPTAMSDILGRHGAAPVVLAVWTWLRWPLLLVLAVVTVAVLYTLTPNVRHPRARWASVGSLFAIATWAVGTGGYAIYVTVVGAYGALYGSIGTLLVALLWVYLTHLALIAGAELDAEFVRLRQLARGIDSTETVQMPVRDLRRNHWIAEQHANDVAAARRLLDEARREQE